jgi:hypothetical protein
MRDKIHPFLPIRRSRPATACDSFGRFATPSAAIDMSPFLKAACVSGCLFASVALAGCSPSEPTAACAVGQGDSAATVSLTVADCTRVQSAFTAQQAAEQAAAAQADQQQQAIRKYRADVTTRIKKDEQNGYRATSVDNFKLYGEELVRSNAKVAVQGVYLKTTRGEFLLPSTQATSQVALTETPDQGINLVSKAANRVTKQAFERCQKDAVGARLGCPMTIVGQAVSCERVTMFGMAEAPCIAVDDSWYIPSPAS